MTTGHQHDHPDYGGIKGGARYDVQHFADTDEEQEMATSPAADLESNELHAASGSECERCHQPIKAGVDVRRTVHGGYVHEVCPR